MNIALGIASSVLCHESSKQSSNQAIKQSRNKHVLVPSQPENIMCQTKRSTEIKLIDFGLAAKLNPEQIAKVTTATAEFAAPEVAEHEPVGFYTDMWAIGVLSYIL